MPLGARNALFLARHRGRSQGLLSLQVCSEDKAGMEHTAAMNGFGHALTSPRVTGAVNGSRGSPNRDLESHGKPGYQYTDLAYTLPLLASTLLGLCPCHVPAGRSQCRNVCPQQTALAAEGAGSNCERRLLGNWTLRLRDYNFQEPHLCVMAYAWPERYSTFLHHHDCPPCRIFATSPCNYCDGPWSLLSALQL